MPRGCPIVGQRMIGPCLAPVQQICENIKVTVEIVILCAFRAENGFRSILIIFLNTVTFTPKER